MSSVKSPDVVRSTVADSWRWMWPDVLIRIIPCGIIPFVYITIFHLPLAFLGLTLNDAREQVAIGLLVGVIMAAFATTYRMFIVGSWFRWPTLNDHLLQDVCAVPPAGQVELAQCWRRCLGRPGFQFVIPGATYSTFAAGRGDCSWFYDCWFSQLG